MSKFRCFGRKLAATVATAAAMGSNTAASLFSQGSNTAAPLIVRCIHYFSRLKHAFYSRVCRTGSNTFPNYSQEIEPLREEKEISPVIHEFANSYDLGDEFDHEDYDEWEADYLDWLDDNQVDWDDGDWDDGDECTSWHERAVDEAIEDEQEDEYPRTDRSHGDW
jgi:hypothetical protein